MTPQESATLFRALVTPELERRIRAAALEDEGFLDRLLDEPKEAYRTHFGEDLLPGEEIEVREHADGGRVLFLPRLNSGMIIFKTNPGANGDELDEDELSDTELEMVAGGGGKKCQDEYC